MIGEVVHIHAEEGVIDDRYHVDFTKLEAIGRMAGSLFCRTTDRYEVKTEDYLPPQFKPS